MNVLCSVVGEVATQNVRYKIGLCGCLLRVWSSMHVCHVGSVRLTTIAAIKSILPQRRFKLMILALLKREGNNDKWPDKLVEFHSLLYYLSLIRNLMKMSSGVQVLYHQTTFRKSL